MIDVDLRRYGEDKDYQKAVNSFLKEAEFHCGFEESGGHAFNCNDCPNKCEEWYQWDKENDNEKR